VPGGSPVNSPTVLRKINGLWLAVRVIASGFRDEGGTLDYTTTDCSGTAYNKILDFPVAASTFIAAGIVHYADPRIAQNQQFASRQNVFRRRHTGSVRGHL
jgi:hypothetical protein